MTSDKWDKLGDYAVIAVCCAAMVLYFLGILA